MHRALSRLTDSVSHNGCNGQNRLLIKLHPFALASINLLSLFAAVRIIFNDFFQTIFDDFRLRCGFHSDEFSL